MMDINSLIILDKVADKGSFSEAARALKMPKSNVSLKISQLEEALGLKLFERSTRKVRITDHGERIRNLTLNLIEIVNDIQSVAESANSEPRGNLKISASYDLGHFLIREVIPNFLQKYPQIRIELELENRYVNLIEEGYDLAIRASGRNLSDSSQVSVKLATTRFYLFAQADAPEKKIRHIQDTHNLSVLLFGGRKTTVYNQNEEWELSSTSRIKVSDMLGAKEAILAGLGIGLLPEFICKNELEKGTLVKVLPQWSSTEANFYAVYPSKRLVLPKTKVFIEYLKQVFRKDKLSI